MVRQSNPRIIKYLTLAIYTQKNATKPNLCGFDLCTELELCQYITCSNPYQHLFQHHAPAQNCDEYNEAYIGLVGDQDEKTNPTAVKIKPGPMTWREVALVADYGDNSAMDAHYNDQVNKYTFFDATGKPKAAQKVNIPKLPTPPAKLVLKIAMMETTPWELWHDRGMGGGQERRGQGADGAP